MFVHHSDRGRSARHKNIRFLRKPKQLKVVDCLVDHRFRLRGSPTNFFLFTTLLQRASFHSTHRFHRHRPSTRDSTAAGKQTDGTTKTHAGLSEYVTPLDASSTLALHFDHHHVVPILTPEQALLWNHKYANAATSATQNTVFQPMSLACLLGKTVSRIL
jgi:hypothetical protein